MNEPFVTIIVSVYNAERTIKKCIDSLLLLDYPNYEIVIIDDGSEDRTKEILSEYRGKIHLIETKHSGPSRCRNIAVLESKGNFIAFTDSDCIVDKAWLRELMSGFSDEKIVALGGVQHSPHDETSFGKTVQLFFELTGFLGGYIKSKNKKDIIKVSHNPSCNVIYKKDIFLEVGGFDEMLWPCEDVDLDYRLKKKGFEFAYNPKAIVYHYRPGSVRELSRMMYRYGVMQGILTKRYGIFRRIQFLPIFFLVLLVLFAINKNFLWLMLAAYLFLLFKVPRITKSILVFYLSLVSALIWTYGLFKGILIRR